MALPGSLNGFKPDNKITMRQKTINWRGPPRIARKSAQPFGDLASHEKRYCSAAIGPANYTIIRTRQPLSLATTNGLDYSFFSSGYYVASLHPVDFFLFICRRITLCGGFPPLNGNAGLNDMIYARLSHQRPCER